MKKSEAKELSDLQGKISKLIDEYNKKSAKYRSGAQLGLLTSNIMSNGCDLNEKSTFTVERFADDLFYVVDEGGWYSSNSCEW